MQIHKCKSIPAGKKLKHKDAERPQIGGEIVTFVQDYFWSNILRSTAERPRLATLSDLLGKPEIHLYPAAHTSARDSIIPISEIVSVRVIVIVTK